jgi:Uma2 family endonuclease
MAIEVDIPRRLFTVEEYQRMAEVGIFHPDERIELIEGEIVQMAPIGPRHAGCVINATRLFITRLGERAVPASTGSALASSARPLLQP